MKFRLSFNIVLVFSFFIFLLSYFSIGIPITHAQLGLGLSDSDISVDVTPENPGPNQQVVVQIQSFSTDLNASSISWLVNGKNVLSGIGKKQISLSTGTLGQKIAVQIIINSPNGSVEKDFSITPASVDVLFEARTYTPPFFKGKPMFSAQSTVTFVALPHIVRNGSEIPAGNLVYTWANNGTVFGDQSGYGKDSLTIVGSLIPRPLDVTVTVNDPNTGAIASGESELTSGTPFVLLYKNDPLYGVQYEKALQGSYTLTGNEINVSAVPYYFSVYSAYSSALNYDWRINGFSINDGLNNPNKVFRRIGDTYGISNISVAVSHNQAMFQTAKANVLINFQK